MKESGIDSARSPLEASGIRTISLGWKLGGPWGSWTARQPMIGPLEAKFVSCEEDRKGPTSGADWEGFGELVVAHYAISWTGRETGWNGMGAKMFG